MESKPGPSTSVSGPSTSVTDSNVGLMNIGPGNITARDVNIYHSTRLRDEFPLPQGIHSFHGREREISALVKAFFSEDKEKAVICGPGGFGKSELSKQFAQQSLEEGKVDRVLWVPADNPNELKESFKKLKPIYDSCAGEQLLLIFDNCDNQQSIAEYEPRNQNHHVLITSQNKQWKSDVKIIELEPLSPESAIEVFKSVLGDKYNDEDEHLYEDLARLVGYIPLGLQITASFVEQKDDDDNLAEYVNEIIKSQENILDDVIPEFAVNSYNKSLYAAMIASVDKIKNKKDQKPRIRELAHNLLCLSAYLHPDSMAKVDLLSLVNVKNKDKYTDNELKLALKLISNFSFLRYGDDKKSYVVQHRTIQLFLRHYISKSNCQCKYYKMCLEWALEEHGFVNYSPIILNYADSNLTVVYDFYQDNYMHKDMGPFLKMLIRCKCIECIKTIFKDPDEQTKTLIYQHDLLSECASAKNLQILQILLSHVDINARNDNQDTALHVLARSEDLNGIKLLVSHGADVNVLNATGDPPLFTFIRVTDSFNDWDWDDVFSTFKSDFSVTNSNNQTLLHAAVAGRKTELVDILIKNGLQVNHTDNNGWTPLDSIYKRISELDDPYAFISNNAKILKSLLTAGAKSNNKHKTTRTDDAFEFVLLNNALIRNDLDLLELLLNSGVDVNSRSHCQQTILHRCVYERKLKATQIVINHNADCYVRDSNGNTPLFYFVKNEGCYDSDMDFLKDMLDLLQCHPGHVDAAGNTVLHVATRELHVQIIEMLVTVYEFNVNIQNSNGDTPLHALLSFLKVILSLYDPYKEKIIQIIKMFNSYNARLDLKNNTGETPLDMLQRICTEEYSHIINDLSPYLTPAAASM